jgi:tight adherence protein B
VSTWLPAALAGASAATAVAAPRVGAVRLRELRSPAGAVPVLLPSAAVALGVLLVGGPVAALVVGAGALLLGRAVAGHRLAADRARERAAVVEALSLLAGELRAGRAPAEALAVAAGVATGPTRAALAAAAATAQLGGDVAAILSSDLATESALPAALAGLGACWQVCQQTGAGLAHAVERLEESGRAAESHRRAVDAELAGPRATAQLLAGLPLAGIALAAALGADPLHVLLHTAAGAGCLLGGLVLDALGLLWTRRLVAAAGG